MPKPVGSDQRYMPGLDGLRAIAVLAVIAFHEQFSWAPGGLLGVGVFFTLSGFLITDLLLSKWLATGRANLGNFWARRARRLLPALFVMLAIVTAWVTLLDRARLASLRGAVAAAATYTSNWYLIVGGSVLLLALRPAAAARSSLVARGRGAVLPDLAVGAAGRHVPDPPPPHHCRRPLACPADAGTGRRVRRSHVGHLPACRRPDEGLRGHRYPRLRPADRRRGRDAVVQPDSRPVQQENGQDPGRSRRPRARRDRGDDLARRPVLDVPVPRRPGRPQRRQRRRGGGRCLPGQPGGGGARLASAALDRRPVVWHLPVALSGHRAHDSGQQHGGPDPCRLADRGEHRARGAVLEVCRGARPARRHRAGLEPPAHPPARRARCIPAGGGRRRDRGRPGGASAGSREWSPSRRPPAPRRSAPAPARCPSRRTRSATPAPPARAPHPVRSPRRCSRTARCAPPAPRSLHIGDSTSEGMVSTRLPARPAPAAGRQVRGRRRAERLHQHHRRALGSRGRCPAPPTATTPPAGSSSRGSAAAGCSRSAPTTPQTSRSGPTSG